MTADREALKAAVLKALADVADYHVAITKLGDDVYHNKIDPGALADAIVDAVIAVDGVEWRDEWRVCAGSIDGGYPAGYAVFKDGIRSEEHLAIVLREAHEQWRGEHLWAQRRRVGTTEWERVDA